MSEPSASTSPVRVEYYYRVRWGGVPEFLDLPSPVLRLHLTDRAAGLGQLLELL